MLRAVLRPAFTTAAATAAGGLASSAHADYRGPEAPNALNTSLGALSASQAKTVNATALEAHASTSAVAPKFGLEEEWNVVDRGEDGEFVAQLLERPPQKIEVQEATRELEAMFARESYAEGDHDDSGASSDTETELASPAPEDMEEEIPFSRTRGVDSIMTHWRDPSETAAIARRQSGARSVVARAFELMERDPEVRDTVVDLATDPNIWAAVMNNQSLRNLRAKRQAARIHEVAANDPREGSVQTSGVKLQSLFGHISNGVSRLLETCMDMVHGIQAFIQKQLLGTGVGGAGEGDCAPHDPYLQAVGVMVVLVLAVIIIKRAP
ncbi:hypothetical protein KFL_000030170 [Klebsormidium nitens]|uniref:Uncharacterized protein n=1 Tax=Klebsormidium nitens TaxID=105231 RepID=A0A1Y1HPJ2_KLENI|nr:hypothetical protein KFL_000030170 [Klebsormidium nitens]|eukprot:GAQ77738.1 hypothetical protein KFL_000030170 [Klebsormidium nitens]